MSAPTVQDVYNALDAIAPFELQEDFDNAGILIGRKDALVTTILCTLDVTMTVVDEAIKMGAQLIVSHHPLLFHATHTLVEGNPEVDVICALIRANIALISAHTNIDKSPLSGSACAAKALGLQNIKQQGYVFYGNFDKPLTKDEVAQKVRAKLNTPLRVYGCAKEIGTLAIAGGAYGEGYMEALSLNAQAYMTGEIRHHEAVDACARGMLLLEGGHYATEVIFIPALCQYLQNVLNTIQYKVRVFPSTCVPYAGALE